jgi:multicomponent K+:H+ antiporter subunit E
MSMLQRILPQPWISVGITGLWLVLASTYNWNSLLMGLVVALLIPQFTRAFWPDQPVLRHPLLAIQLFLLVCMDIIRANWELARLILGPVDRIRPAFFDVPLDVQDPFVATLLASIISLTPGTVSIDIDMEAGRLHVHAFDLADEAAQVATIKTRYEAPLRKIFGC